MTLNYILSVYEALIFAAVMSMSLPIIVSIIFWLYDDKEQEQIDDEYLDSFINESFKNN